MKKIAYIAAFTATLFFMPIPIYSVQANAQNLTLLMDNWPPFHYQDKQGNNIGFATDVMRAVLNNMGTDYSIKMEPFTRVLYAIRLGKADGSFTSTKDGGKQEFSYFPAESIASVNWVFFTRRADSAAQTLTSYKDLQGRRVGIVRGYTYTEEFWEQLKRHKIPYTVVNYDTQNFKKLAAGRIDYVPAVLENGLYLVNQLGLSKKIVPIKHFVVKKSELYATWSKKRVDKVFVKRFSTALKLFKHSDDYTTLYHSYFHDLDACESCGHPDHK